MTRLQRQVLCVRWIIGDQLDKLVERDNGNELDLPFLVSFVPSVFGKLDGGPPAQPSAVTLAWIFWLIDRFCALVVAGKRKGLACVQVRRGGFGSRLIFSSTPHDAVTGQLGETTPGPYALSPP